MMEGRVIAGDPQARWRGAALDSRRVTGGELFFALAGERSDGHLYVADALARGAAAALVHRDLVVASGTLVRVADTYGALHALTRAQRERAPQRLVAVTGSVGKTTTKDLLALMLGRRFRVAGSPGNLNNLYGFPLALLGIAEDTEWMVAEMGMSTPGEMAAISRLGKPDVAVFTNVRPAHLEKFGDLRAVAAAKAELLEGLTPGGLVVANADDPEVRWIAARHQGPLAWYALEGEAPSRAMDVEPLPGGSVGSRFRWRVDGGEHEVVLPLHGRYNVANFLAAATAAHAAGVPAAEIVAAVAAAAPAAGRGRVRRRADGAVVVDDTYNSNPSALSEALAAAAELPAARRWAVLGDMLELGEGAAQFHREAGQEAARRGFSPIVGVGELARELVAAAAEAGAETAWFPTAAAAAAAVPPARPGDAVLVKGSRGVGLEVVVAGLLGEESS
jgi:UDP-N-acetylmuramoyl-tripeptide--D-alanyl-D-alanine ligase